MPSITPYFPAGYRRKRPQSVVSRARTLSGRGATDLRKENGHWLLERRWRCVASATQTWHWRSPFHHWRPPWPRSRSRTSPTGILSAATSTSTASTARLAWVWTAAMRRHDEAGEEIAVGDFLEGLVRHRGLQIRNMARYLSRFPEGGDTPLRSRPETIFRALSPLGPRSLIVRGLRLPGTCANRRKQPISGGGCRKRQGR
jgi:hypothetical protein